MMCQVFGVTGVNDKNRSSIIQVMKEITPSMTQMEDDGVGYAGIDKDGTLFGERWLEVKDAFKKRPKTVDVDYLDTPILEQFNDVVDSYDEKQHSPASYNKFGDVDMKKAVAFVLHSRYSTGGDGSVTIENTHPFVKNGTAMIHNGIVYNESDFKKEISTCDSEILLNQYEKHNVNMDSRNMDDAFKNVSAYFACLFLTNTLNENQEMVPIFDVFQNGARLKIVHVHELKATFFVTNAPDLMKICKKKGWLTSRAYSVSENILIRINAITGQVMEKQEFNYDNGYKYASRSTASDIHSEAYLKSRYGSEWENYNFDHNGVPNDLDEPAYRNEATLYDATRFPYEQEMNEFRRQASNEDKLVTYIGNRKY